MSNKIKNRLAKTAANSELRKQIIVALLNKGYILRNGEELGMSVDYIEEKVLLGEDYTAEKWVQDTIDNYPEILVKI